MGQLPLTSGALLRRWTAGGRDHAEYAGRMPLPIAFASAHYEISQGRAANGVPVEVYFNSAHRRSVPTIMQTARQGLAFYADQFGPYPRSLPALRVVEYPGYWKSAHAEPGVVFYNEGAGFSLAHPAGAIDITLAHELAHTWWDLELHGAQVQGKDVLAEALPTYSALMLIEHVQGREAVQPYVDYLRNLYLDRVSREEIELQPVARGESALNSYLKGSLVLYTLREAIGADAVNCALRGFLAEHAGRPPPNPTMRELVAALRAAAGPQFQQLITDLFDKVTFYDVAARTANVRKVAGGYEVTLEITATKRYADGQGNETGAPLLAPFDVAIFGAGEAKPLYLRSHWLKTGVQRIVVRVKSPPKRAAVDPYGMMIDRRPDDNTLEL
jgi:aminopeptidase N